MFATAFVVMTVLKTVKTKALPEYIKALLISSAYFVATGSTQVFSQAGNNFAKIFPRIILSGAYSMIFWYLLTASLGFGLGFTIFSFVHTSDHRVSRLVLEEKDIMEREERNTEPAEDFEEIKEQKSLKKL